MADSNILFQNRTVMTEEVILQAESFFDKISLQHTEVRRAVYQTKREKFFKVLFVIFRVILDVIIGLGFIWLASQINKLSDALWGIPLLIVLFILWDKLVCQFFLWRFGYFIKPMKAKRYLYLNIIDHRPVIFFFKTPEEKNHRLIAYARKHPMPGKCQFDKDSVCVTFYRECFLIETTWESDYPEGYISYATIDLLYETEEFLLLKLNNRCVPLEKSTFTMQSTDKVCEFLRSRIGEEKYIYLSGDNVE
ncbi:MAG: hypothetical protein IJZ64_02150 [Ruminococcus sp.]|nr:hypothetical protein [Ruminococcus sp.]